MSEIDYQALRAAAAEEIMLRSVCDTSDNWQDLATPEAVIVLVETLEADKEQVKTLESRNRRLEGIITAAEKRIAELESNEVREVGNQFLVVRHPGKTPVIKHCTGDLEEFLRKLIEQDPLVTIDIITHRYYGVGGQWVQDAGEYLHMMSDAGIRIKEGE
nr:MAG TPA: Ead/Ea22-like protein [Caudoviricetes sp.]